TTHRAGAGTAPHHAPGGGGNRAAPRTGRGREPRRTTHRAADNPTAPPRTGGFSQRPERQRSSSGQGVPRSHWYGAARRYTPGSGASSIVHVSPFASSS